VFLDRTVELHTKADRLSLAWRAVMADLVAPDPAGRPGPPHGDATPSGLGPSPAPRPDLIPGELRPSRQAV
jgi:hypothetical protein